MYRLVLTARAKNQLKTFKKSHQQAIALVIEELKEDSFLGKSLIRELIGRFSLRVGVYRLIYKINQKDKVMTILNFDHRGLLYN